jgi:NADH:ubiquinone oxidoreductase subunit 3 (subunit A)
MKLHLLFIIIDILILLAYPIVYIVHRVRKVMGVK